MSVFEAILLGIIQGVSEFLPISSTAHLTLAGKFMMLIDPARPEQWTAFIAIMQLGTMASVMIYFYRDILNIITSLYNDLTRKREMGSDRWSANSILAFQIALGTVPVVIIGLAFKDIIHGMFTKELTTIATSLIVLAAILFMAEKVGRRIRGLAETTWKDALSIGLAQALALIPGSSRSGTTITAGLFLGLTRETAARFSFLLSIPAIFASGLYELYEIRDQISQLGMTPLVVSTIVSGIVGYASIAFLLRFLRTHTTYAFIVYRILLGIFLWVLIYNGAG